MTTPRSKIRMLTRTALFTALIALGAFMRIPVPFVPFTMQYFFTMMAGLVLGSKYGAISAGAYVGLGLIGVPIFSGGGGFDYVLRPTFGYLIGFIIGTYVTGLIAERHYRPKTKRLLAAAFSGLAIVYLCGTIYFYFMQNLYLGEPISLFDTLKFCILLPIPGDILLCVLAAELMPRLYPVLHRRPQEAKHD